MKKTAFILPVIVILVAVFLSSVFIVDEREKALVLQFGKVVKVKEDPGLAFKIPLIQQVVRYDDRILGRDIEPLEVTPLDDRRLVVDAFARYRVENVRQFRRAVGTGGIRSAEDRLDRVLRAATSEVLGSVSSNDILSSNRAALMLRIRNAAIEEAKNLGLDIIDVRLMRTDLPEQNLSATYSRMRAEREREAADEIARGEEAAQRIRAQADRTVVELVSDATRQAEIVRGEADAKRNAIFADAYGADEKFFEFYRSLTAYDRALQSGNSTMVMSPDNEFFNYLNQADSLALPTDVAPVMPEDTSEAAPAEAIPTDAATTPPASTAETPTADNSASTPGQ